MSKINFLYPFNVTGAINSSSTYNINNNTVLSPTTLTLTTTSITNGGTYNLKLPSTLGTSNQALMLADNNGQLTWGIGSQWTGSASLYFNGYVAINKSSTPAFALDVSGTINASTGYNLNGNVILSTTTLKLNSNTIIGTTGVYSLTLPTTLGTSNQALMLLDNSGTLGWGIASQWIGSSSLYFNGNVGINKSTSPSYPLDVSGIVNASSYSISGNSVLSSTTLKLNGNTIIGTTGVYSLTLPTTLGTSNQALMLLDNSGTLGWGIASQWTGTTSLYFNGNVGINKSTSPSYPLDVSGIVNAGSYSISGNSVLSSTTLKLNGNTIIGTTGVYSLTLPTTLGTSSQALMLLDNSGTLGWGIASQWTGTTSLYFNGNVSINKNTAPSYPLDVNGIVNAGSYSISGNSVLSSTTLGTGIINSSLTSVGTLSSLAVTGAVTSGINTITGTSSTGLIVKSSVASTGNVQITGGTTTSSGGIVFNGSSSVMGNIYGSTTFNVLAGPSMSTNFGTTTTTLMTLNTSGYLGINTSSPLAPLHISTSVGLASFNNSNMNIIFSGGSVGMDSYGNIIASTTNSQNYWTIYDKNNNPTFYVSTNGYTNASVQGDFYIAPPSKPGLAATSSGPVKLNLGYGTNVGSVYTNYYWTLYSSSSNSTTVSNLNINQPNGTNVMTLTSTGYLGINTSSPAYALDIYSGGARVGYFDNNGLFVNNTIKSSADMYITTLGSANKIRLQVYPNDIAHITNNGIYANRYAVDISGSNVADNTNTTGGPWYGLGSSVETATNGYVQLAGYNGLSLRTGSGYIVMKLNGNVGIGTTSPGTLLDVNGGASFNCSNGTINFNNSNGIFMTINTGVGNGANSTTIWNNNNTLTFVGTTSSGYAWNNTIVFNTAAGTISANRIIQTNAVYLRYGYGTAPNLYNSSNTSVSSWVYNNYYYIGFGNLTAQENYNWGTPTWNGGKMSVPCSGLYSISLIIDVTFTSLEFNLETFISKNGLNNDLNTNVLLATTSLNTSGSTVTQPFIRSVTLSANVYLLSTDYLCFGFFPDLGIGYTTGSGVLGSRCALTITMVHQTTTGSGTITNTNNTIFGGYVGIGTGTPIAPLTIGTSTALSNYNVSMAIIFPGNNQLMGMDQWGNIRTNSTQAVSGNGWSICDKNYNVVFSAYVDGTKSSYFSGNVGIGTGSPGYPLDIYSSGSQVAYFNSSGMYINNINPIGSSDLKLSALPGYSIWFINNNNIMSYVNSDGLTVNNGLLKFGNTTTNYNLSTQNFLGLIASSLLFLNSNNSTPLIINSSYTGSTYQPLNFQLGNATVASFNSSGMNITGNIISSSGNFVIQSSATNAGGNIQIQSQSTSGAIYIYIGTAIGYFNNSGFIFQKSNGGITFNNSNVKSANSQLNAYETGTYTTPLELAISGSATVSVQYTRIGNIVNIIANTGTSTFTVNALSRFLLPFRSISYNGFWIGTAVGNSYQNPNTQIAIGSNNAYCELNSFTCNNNNCVFQITYTCA